MSSVIGGQSAVGSDFQFSSTSNGYSSSSPIIAAIGSIREKLIQLAISVQSKEPIRERFNILLFFILQIYILISSLFLPTITLGPAVDIYNATLSTNNNSTTTTENLNFSFNSTSHTLGYYRYGYYGYWIFNVLTYPTTLSLDRIPYYGALGLSFGCMALIAIYAILLGFTYRGMLLSSNNFWRLKLIVRRCSGCLILASLTMTFIMTSFIDCNYFSGVLNRFPQEDVQCFSVENIIYIIIFFLTIFSLWACLGFAQFVFINTHPHSRTLFVAQNSFCTSFYWLSTNVELMLIYIIPQAYGRSIVHVVLSAIQVPIFFMSIPFFRRFENSVFFGFICGKLGLAVGSLISSFSNSMNLWDFGLGMAGLSFGLLIIFSLCGFVFMEVYTRIVYRNTREILIAHNLEENDSERDAIVQYQYFEDTKKLKYLSMFLRFAVRSGEPENGSDIDIAIQFIKSLIQHKSFNDPDILTISSIIVSFCWLQEANSCTLGLRIVRSALKQHNAKYFSKLSLMERMRQIEFYSDHMFGSKKNNSELGRVLLRLEKQQIELFSHHKNFWKEMINDKIDFQKLDYLTDRISSLSTECDITFENLRNTYGNEKTLLRKYASFVENFKFDSNLAQQLYTEATLIEEEESRTRKKLAWQEYKSKGMVGSNNSIEYEQPKKQESIAFLKEETATESAETADRKKETMLKSALRLPDSNKRPKIFIISWTILSLLLICTFIILSTVFSVLPTREINHLKNSCQPKGITSRVAAEIRTAQILLELYSDTTLSTYISQNFGINNSQAVIDEFKGRMEPLFDSITQVSTSSEEETTTSDGYALYTTSIYNITVPSMVKNSTKKSKEARFIQTIDQKVSILDVTHMLINHKKTIAEYSEADFKKTAENYSVMFLLKNRAALDEIYSNFCANFAEITKLNTENYLYGFLGFFLATLVLYLSGGILFFSITALSLFKTGELLKLLDRDVPKAVAVSIVAQISKKCDEEVSLKTQSNFLQAKRLVLVLGTILLLCNVVTFTMLFVSAYLNNSRTISNVSSLKLVSDSKIKLGSANFQIGELLIYKKLNNSYNSNDLDITSLETVSNFYSNIKSSLEGSLKVWNQAILEMDISSNEILSNFVTGSASCNSTTSTCGGLNSLLSEFIVSSQQLLEKIQSESFPYSTITIIEEYLTLFFLGDNLNSKLMELEDYFVTLNASPIISLLLIFSILGLSQCVLFSYMVFTTYASHWKNTQQTRLLLNYIPWENLDSNEKLKNYILYHDISSQSDGNSKGIFSRKKKRHYQEGNEDRVRSILGAAVDGAVLCNQSGDIEIFNPAAQKLFGHRPHEIVGLSVFTLFEPTSNSKIKQVMEEMCQALIENANNKLTDPIDGETLEVDCFRKNQSKFPARINFFCTLFGRTPVVTFFVKDISSERKQNLLLAEEKKKSEALLLNILPESVAIRIKSGESLIAEKFADVTVFFSDMVGFTKLSSNMEAIELVKMLSIIVNGFDSLTDKYQLEKIKTIGDAYFCVGLTGKDHPERVLKFAIEVFTVIHNYNAELIRDDRLMKLPKKFDENGVEIPVEQRQLNVRVGINTGPVVAGVIGSKKFAYDLWGDTINMASRMESNSKSGRIQVSKSTFERVFNLGYRFEERELDVKGKGICECYLLDSRFHMLTVLDEAAIKKLFDDEIQSDKQSQDQFAEIDLYRSDNYRFTRLITEHSFIASFKLYLNGPKLDIILFYERVLEFKQTESIPVRYGIAKNLVELYLQEKATNRLNFKFMKNAFGPFQLRFNTCTEDNCPTDLFDNFVNLSTKALKPELPKFLKSSQFSSYVENLRIADPDLLSSLLKSSKNGNTTETSSDTYDEDEEKEFLLFCEKCGTEIINLENHRFNDFEFNYRLDNLNDYNQWKVLNEYPDGKTFLSPEVAHNHLSNSRRHTQLKYTFEVDLDYEKVFNMWMDTEYFTLRDPNICSFTPVDFVKVGKYAHGISHEVYKFTGLGQSDREIVHAYCCRFDSEQKRYLCVSRSINNPKVLESSKYTRAEIKTAFMVEHLEENKSRYTYAVIFDPMGMLGADYFYSSIKDGKDNYHKLFKEHLIERGIKKNHERPKDGLFVQSLDHYIGFMEEKQRKRALREQQAKEQNK